MSRPLGECLWCDQPAVEFDEHGSPLCEAHAEEWKAAKDRAEAEPLRSIGDAVKGNGGVR